MSSVSASGSAGKSGERNKFQAEDDWLSIEKSKALAGYATGLMDYNEYIEKKQSSINSIFSKSCRTQRPRKRR